MRTCDLGVSTCVYEYYRSSCTFQFSAYSDIYLAFDDVNRIRWHVNITYMLIHCQNLSRLHDTLSGILGSERLAHTYETHSSIKGTSKDRTIEKRGWNADDLQSAREMVWIAGLFRIARTGVYSRFQCGVFVDEERKVWWRTWVQQGAGGWATATAAERWSNERWGERGWVAKKRKARKGARWQERRDVLITSIDVHLQWIDVWSVLHHAQGSTGRNRVRTPPAHLPLVVLSLSQLTLCEGWAQPVHEVNRNGVCVTVCPMCAVDPAFLFVQS